MRMSILNVDETVVTPARFRGWLRDQATNIQRTAKTENTSMLVLLFMSEKYRLSITQSALNEMIQDIVEANPNIAKVELLAGRYSLTIKEAQVAAETIKNELNAMYVASHNGQTMH